MKNKMEIFIEAIEKAKAKKYKTNIALAEAVGISHQHIQKIIHGHSNNLRTNTEIKLLKVILPYMSEPYCDYYSKMYGFVDEFETITRHDNNSSEFVCPLTGREKCPFDSGDNITLALLEEIKEMDKKKKNMLLTHAIDINADPLTSKASA